MDVIPEIFLIGRLRIRSLNISKYLYGKSSKSDLIIKLLNMFNNTDFFKS